MCPDPQRLRLWRPIVPASRSYMQLQQTPARPWRIVAAEAAQEMDSQRLLSLLEELNQALEQQGLVKPDGQGNRGKA